MLRFFGVLLFSCLFDMNMNAQFLPEDPRIKYLPLYESLHIRSDRDAEEKCDIKHFYRWLDRWYPMLVADQHLKNNYTPDFANHKGRSWEPQWKPLGPNSAINGIGRLNCIAFHPANKSILYCGAPAGGFWRSNDAGIHWITTTDHLLSVGVSEIAIDPEEPDHILIGTGDRDLWSSTSIGILKSEDGGITWKETNVKFKNSDFELIVRIIFDPSDSRIVYALSKRNVYKSIDNGANFDVINDQIKDASDMELHPQNSDILYIGTEKGNLYLSEDAGMSWNEITDRIGFPDIGRKERLTLAVSRSQVNMLYVMSQGEPHNNLSSGIYKSSNSAKSFKKMTVNQSSNVVNWYGYTLAASETDSNHIYCGGGYAFRSDDGGANWIQPHQAAGNHGDGTFVHVDMHDMQFNGNTIFIACDGGLYKDEGFKNKWDYISGDMVIGQAYGFASSQQDPHKLIIGFQDLGSGISDNKNYTVSIGGDGMDVHFDYKNDRLAYFSAQLGYFLKSNPETQELEDFVNSNIIGEGGAWTTPLWLDKNNSDHFLVAYENLWETYDGGHNWKRLSNLPKKGIPVHRIIVSPSDSNVIYLMKEWGFGMFRTFDKGKNWTEIEYPLAISLDNLSVDPQNPFLIIGTARYYGEGLKVFQSVNAGDSWINISGSLPNVLFNSVLIQENTFDTRVFVGCEYGVFYKDKRSSDWTQLGTGLPNVDLRKIEYYKPNNSIRVGTYGRGLWECNIDHLDALNAKDISDNKLSVFPNPIKSQCRIQSQDPILNIELIDINGISRLSLPFESQHEVYLDTQLLPSGFYNIVVTSKNSSQIIKSIIIN